MNLEPIIADLVRRIPALAQDCAVNNEVVIRQLLEPVKAELDKLHDMANFVRQQFPEVEKAIAARGVQDSLLVYGFVGGLLANYTDQKEVLEKLQKTMWVQARRSICPKCGALQEQPPGSKCIRDHKGCDGITIVEVAREN